MKKIGKKLLATILTATLVFGLVGVVGAQTKGQDVSAGRNWTSYSIHGNNAEDKGEWESELKSAHQVWNTKADKAAVQAAAGKLDAYYTYGECAKYKSSEPGNYVLDVTSTGWSANYNPFTGQVMSSNPWGVTTTKVVPVERGRYYTISFKTKSTLQNEITKCDDTTVLKGVKNWDGKDCHYTEGTGKYNYVKHFHIKAYDNKDEGGSALPIQSIKATYNGNNVMSKTKDFNNLIAMDSRNSDYVDVTMTVLVPSEKSDYQSKTNSPTMGIKFAYGPFLKEYKDENNMSGEVEVKDFKVIAGTKVVGPTSKVGKIKVGKKKMTVKYSASGAKRYVVQVSLKKNFSKIAKTVKTNKTSATIKKLKAKKKYYVRVKAAKYVGGVYVYGAWSKAKRSKKIKKK